MLEGRTNLQLYSTSRSLHLNSISSCKFHSFSSHGSRFFQVRIQIGTVAMNLANIETFKRNKKHRTASLSVPVYSGTSVAAENLNQGCTMFQSTSKCSVVRIRFLSL
jgi:hypothetical protein